MFVATITVVADPRMRPFSFVALVAIVAFGVPSRAQRATASSYLLYVASEAADRIALLRFDGTALHVERDFGTGVMPVDIDGPHGLAVSPDGRFFFVSLAHGQPNGAVWKYDTATGGVVGRVTLGMFPATLQVSPSGEFVYVVNFNLHGDPVPSSVSVVHAERMLEIARIPTCRMPHGSRFNAQGTRHYSACMMDDMVVEIDTGTLRVARHFSLSSGGEGGGAGPPPARAAASHDASGHGTSAKPGSATCSPTWVQPSADGNAIFVACNGTSEIVEIATGAWTVPRRLPARPGVYNLAATRDGRLLATNRRDASVSIFDLKTGREAARITTPRQVVHGVVVTPDDRFAFASVEGIGAEPGTVVAIDLGAMKAVATIDVGPQAGGIDFWKMDQ